MPSRSNSASEYHLIAGFETLRRTLAAEQYADRWRLPIAHWALPSDRRLPRAFLGRTLREILETPFAQLYATPGIGERKFRTLLELLRRAASADGEPVDPVGPVAEAQPLEAAAPGAGDSWNVSEAQWARWRAAVNAAGLEHESLGRFANSLEQLPRVIWRTPLSVYSHLTLAEIRELRTHGEKRVAAVLEVFRSLSSILAPLQAQPHLAARIMPRFTGGLEAWIRATLGADQPPGEADVRQYWVVPLVEQLRVDGGELLGSLAMTRLGMVDRGTSVRQAARHFGLTRARIYQLLDDIGAIFEVRWPEGRALVSRLQKQARHTWPDGPARDLYESSAYLFFPTKAREERPVPAPPSRIGHLLDERRANPARTSWTPRQPVG